MCIIDYKLYIYIFTCILMGMLELVVRSRLGRDGNNHTSSSLVTHKYLYNIKLVYFFFLKNF